MTKNQASVGLYYKTSKFHYVRKMDRSRSKLVRLSEPVKVNDYNKDTSLQRNLSIPIHYESAMLYSTYPQTCLLAHAWHILRQTFG
jgi:hypothetical protein